MNTDQARARLTEERSRHQQVRDAADRLVTAANQADAAELSSADQHPADSATETLERELEGSVMQRALVDLEEIDAAIARLDAGTYGACEACGQPIAEARLEAMPAARYCIEDQARLERENAGGSAAY